MNDIAINVIANVIAGIIGGVSVVIYNFVNKNFLDRQVKWKWAIAAVGLVTLLLSGLLTTLGQRYFALPSAANLSSYIALDGVDDDLDGTDFGWIPLLDPNPDSLFRQDAEPGLANATVGGISGRFVKYPVMLKSVMDASGYSNGDPQAILQRKLRNAERRTWDTLLVMLYIQSDNPEDTHEVFVIPYLVLPDIGTLYLGFGQTILVNQWTPVVWRQLVTSAEVSSWSDEFFQDLDAIQDKYGIQDAGHIRLTHVLTAEKKDGTRLGLEFRLLSNEAQGIEDKFKGIIYISSVTFLPSQD